MINIRKNRGVLPQNSGKKDTQPEQDKLESMQEQSTPADSEVKAADPEYTASEEETQELFSVSASSEEENDPVQPEADSTDHSAADDTGKPDSGTENTSGSAESGHTESKGRLTKIKAFIARITMKDKPPVNLFRNLITMKRPNMILGGIITILLLLLIFTHTGLFLHDAEMSKKTGRILLIVTAAAAVAAGLATAVNIALPKRFAKIYNFILYFGTPVVAALITECIQGIFIYDWSPKTMALNYVLFLTLYSIVAIITGTFRRTILIITPILFAFSFISMLIKEFRGTPLMPADIVTIRTGLGVASGYTYSLTYNMITAVVLFVLFEIITLRMPRIKVRRRFHHIFRLVSLLLVAGISLPFYLTSIAADNGIKPDFWNQSRGYKNTGTAFNFVLNSRYLIIEKPEDYNASEITDLLHTVTSSTEEDKGILASALKMQEEQTAALEAAEQQTEDGPPEDASAIDPADTATTIENTGTLAELNADAAAAAENTGDNSGLYAFSYHNDRDIEEMTEDLPAEQALPNTGLDTKLAVQYTSDTEQPATSAILKEGELPDLIVVMNETLSDLRILGEFSTNKDYMPFLRNLTKNTIKGNLYMPVNGAGTSNSEFEFLTGNSMAFLPAGSNAYELYIKSRLPSLAQTLAVQGYSRTAYHTYYKNSWKRNVNYPLMGFENFYALEDILDTGTVESYRDGDISLFEFQNRISMMYPDDRVLIRRFVSDSYDYKVLEKMYEERDTSRPFFIFNVTMQNHGSYDLSYSNFDQQIQITSEDSFYPRANRYLSLIYESDIALKELVDYYSSVSRPVMLVMFGDHQPSIEEEFIESLLGTDLNDVTVSQNQKRYVTPFLIWTNYDSQSGYIEKISSNYLSTLVLQQAGLQQTEYNQYLSRLYQQMPVIDTTGYITADNRYYTFDADTEYTATLDGYDKIIYNYMFDQLNRKKDLFYLNEVSEAETETAGMN